MNLVAGLYKTEEQAITAFNALQDVGFQKTDLTLLIRKNVRPPDFPNRASTRDVAAGSFFTALLFGFLGVILVLLVGVGVIPIQQILPSFEVGQTRMIFNLAVTTFFISALIGAIVGAAYKLIRSADKPAITDEGVRRGGLLLVVNVDETQKANAHITLEENGAIDIENLTEKWDTDIWSRYEGVEIA